MIEQRTFKVKLKIEHNVEYSVIMCDLLEFEEKNKQNFIDNILVNVLAYVENEISEYNKRLNYKPEKIVTDIKTALNPKNGICYDKIDICSIEEVDEENRIWCSGY